MLCCFHFYLLPLFSCFLLIECFSLFVDLLHIFIQVHSYTPQDFLLKFFPMLYILLMLEQTSIFIVNSLRTLVTIILLLFFYLHMTNFSSRGDHEGTFKTLLDFITLKRPYFYLFLESIMFQSFSVG